MLDSSFEPGLLGGVVTVTASSPVPDAASLKYIPYYAWDNRTPGPMKVWVDLE